MLFVFSLTDMICQLTTKQEILDGLILDVEVAEEDNEAKLNEAMNVCGCFSLSSLSSLRSACCPFTTTLGK